MLNGHSPVWNLYTDGKFDFDLPVAQDSKNGTNQSIFILFCCFVKVKFCLPLFIPK